MSVVSVNRPVLKILLTANKETYDALLTDPAFKKAILKSLAEIAYNALYTNLPLHKEERKKLCRIKFFLKSLVNSENPRKYGGKGEVLLSKLLLLRDNRRKVRQLLAPLFTAGGSLVDENF